MADTKKNKKEKKEKMVTTRRSVHVVFLSCPHCSSERDHIELCGECGEAMRVIDVVEKFGDDAERFLKRTLKRTQGQKVADDEYVSIDDEEPNIILMGDDSVLNGDNGIDPNDDGEDGSLTEIFPDEDEDGERKSVDVDPDDDLTKALEQLDSEEDDDLTAQDFGFDDGEIPTL